MRILAIIPARSGSKGIPGKNIKLLGERSLLQYTADAAKASEKITDIIVSTDGEEIADKARRYNIEVPFIRPAKLATDTTSSIDLVIHAVSFLEQQGRKYDAVCLLQPTSPFRPKGFIDKAIETFVQSGADSLISVLPVPHQYNPHWVFEPGENGMLKISTGEQEIIKRRQDLPPSFFRDGSIYLTKTSVVHANASFYGNSIAYVESDPLFYANIDHAADWLHAEKKLAEVLPFL